MSNVLCGPLLDARVFLNSAIFLFLALSKASAADPYCAFKVVVKNRFGNPVPHLWVGIIKLDHSQFAEGSTGADGTAAFCDVPLETVDVAVGQDVCGLVTIHNLKARWPDTKQLFFTYEPNPCDHFGLVREQQVLLRVLDEKGNPIEGAQFRGSSGAKKELAVSDSRGRIFALVNIWDTFQGNVSKRGKASEHVSLRVSDPIEKRITLRDIRSR